jgi:hypothetical protein
MRWLCSCQLAAYMQREPWIRTATTFKCRGSGHYPSMALLVQHQAAESVVVVVSSDPAGTLRAP